METHRQLKHWPDWIILRVLIWKCWKQYISIVQASSRSIVGKMNTFWLQSIRSQNFGVIRAQSKFKQIFFGVLVSNYQRLWYSAVFFKKCCHKSEIKHNLLLQGHIIIQNIRRIGSGIRNMQWIAQDRNILFNKMLKILQVLVFVNNIAPRTGISYKLAPRFKGPL